MIRELVTKMYHASERFVRHHQKAVLIAVFFVAVVVVWHSLQPQIAYAQTGGTAAPGANTAAAPVGGATADAAAGINSGSFWIDLLSKILLSIARLFLSLTLFILTFIIQIAGYNGFLNASAVNVGWVMMRDITNMGFVVILLIIAFGTILGVEHYEWKKMLVKMVIAAVVVNFSRTICGLMIDVAQVIMITFVNGIAATAGGNLIRMFNLDSIRDLSTSADPKTFDSPNYFIASIGAVFFSAMVMSVLAVFLVMLVARMIVLWILIVLSPLAFVLSVLPQTESYANQWWHEFGANVITGPVLLFFIWLSFVTAGNGKINDEIAKASVTGQTSNAGQVSDANLLKGNTSGIGSALQWDNMANFIIAIGMLMVGARAASELGGVGGSWAGEAVEFGKKIGKVASGYTLARYTGEKVGEKLAKPAVRLAGTIKNFGKIKLGQLDEKRNEIATNFEKDGRSAGEARATIARLEKKQRTMEPLNRQDNEDYDKAKRDIAKAGIFGNAAASYIASRVVETGGRADKRLEDLEKAAHSQEVIVEETYSTSKSWQGKIKLDLGVREHQIEQFAEAKRKEKYAGHEEKLIKDGDEKFHERGQTILSARAKTEAAESTIKRLEADHELEAKRDAGVEEAKAKLEAVQTGIQTEEALDKFKAQREAGVFTAKANAERRSTERESREAGIKQDAQIDQGVFVAKAAAQGEESKREADRAKVTLSAEQSVGVAAAKAESEQAVFETTTEREQNVALARDQILKKLNRGSEATNLQKTLERQAKVKVEAQTVGDYISAKARSLYQLKQIQEAEDVIVNPASSPTQIAEATSRRETLNKGMVEMGIGNMDRHAAYAEGIQSDILKEAKRRNPSITLAKSMNNTVSSLRNNQLQHLIGLTGRSDLTLANMGSEFNRLPAEIQTQIRLDSEKAAGQGALSMAGLYNIETQPDGTLRTILTESTNDGLDYVEGRRGNALSGSKITSLAGFGGSMDKDASGNIRVSSDESIDIAVKLIAPVTSNITNSIDEYVKQDFASILDNSDSAMTDGLLARLESSSKDARGLGNMLQFAYERMKDVGQKAKVQAVITRLTP